jgi:CheY-like chemotaxis protein
MRDATRRAGPVLLDVTAFPRPAVCRKIARFMSNFTGRDSPCDHRSCFTTKGSSLGVSIIFSFFKSSGVHMKVFTEEGLGTKIPFCPPTPSAAEETDPPPLAPVLSGSETILVVEDDPLVRDVVIAQLRSLGYLTIAAADGKEALILIERGAAFDLLFTDVMMPNGINGPELSDEIASRCPGTKVLFTSGYTDNTIIHDGCLDGGVLLLSKPYRRAQLARMVRMALGG